MRKVDAGGAGHAGGASVGALLGASLVTYLGVHFLDPSLAITWSYAHLARRRALPWIAASLVAGLPPLTAWAWASAAAARPLGHLRRPRVAAVLLIGCFVLVTLGLRYPAPAICIDPWEFVKGVGDGTTRCARWYLTLWSLSRLSLLLRPLLSAVTFIRIANTVLAALALAALAGCARRLARTRGEAVAITLLTWSAFGVAQLVPRYIDVYPTPLLMTALYLWTALGALAGERHLGWPVLLATLGPFFYIGLVLVVPSILLVVWITARRPGGWARLAVAGAIALGIAGAATLPWFGRPFAWQALLDEVIRHSTWPARPGWSGDTLPLAFMFSTRHAAEVLHTLFLVDGVGAVLIGVCGSWLVRQGLVDSRAVLLALVAGPYLAYVVAMDPVFGPFADWDLFSYGAIATSLLGAYAFVCWGRRHARLFGPLLGMALAGAFVHLLARLNALDVDLAQHLRESPYHIDLSRRALVP